MPTKKQPNQSAGKPAKAAGAPAPAKAAAPENTPAAAATTAPDERAQAIAELVRGGMSYSEAKAAIDNDRPAAPVAALPKVDLGKDPGADEEIDPDSIPDPEEKLEVVDVPNEPPEGYKMIEYLYELRDQMGKSRVKKRHRISVTLEHRLFDWLVYGTIVEAQFRGRPDLTIEDFIEIKIKELKAADPTSGGRRDPSTSGPRDNYNPQTGRWNG